jgi:hypothetical protein
MAPGISSPADPSIHAGTHRSRARSAAAALLCLLTAVSLSAATASDQRRAVLRRAEKSGPSVVGTPAPKVVIQLHRGYRSALRRVYRLEGCQELFARLGVDGLEVLVSTTYTVASADTGGGVCRRAEAFTEVGGSTVWLCGSFGWISEKDAAEVLIHEALHNAGLTEQPHDPDGPTPQEIDHMVETHCGF